MAKLESNAGVLSDLACAQCGQTLRRRWTFAFKARPAPATFDVGSGTHEVHKCMFCAVRHLPMLRRSAILASAIGTVISLLNQGDTLLAGDWNTALYWKLPLSYCVPFCVATYSSLATSRR